MRQRREFKVHKWDAEQRAILFLLFTRSTIAHEDLTAIFNCIFANSLWHEGFEDGLDSRRLRKQFYGRTTTAEREKWAEIVRGPSNAEEQAVEDARVQRIKDAAAALGMVLDISVQGRTAPPGASSSMPRPVGGFRDWSKDTVGNEPSTGANVPDSQDVEAGEGSSAGDRQAHANAQDSSAAGDSSVPSANGHAAPQSDTAGADSRPEA